MTAGCTSVVDGVVEGIGDPGEQTRLAIRTALDALAGVGVRPEAVIAVRMSITDRSFADAVGQAHSEAFGTIRPVATMVVVAGLIDPQMLVEVELTAWTG